MEKLSEMSFSGFSRLRRQYGLSKENTGGGTAYVSMSRLKKSITAMTEDDFRTIKKKYSLGKNVTRDTVVNRMVTIADRMENDMVIFLAKEADDGGIHHLVELMRKNFPTIKALAGANSVKENLMQDNIQGY